MTALMRSAICGHKAIEQRILECELSFWVCIFEYLKFRLWEGCSFSVVNLWTVLALFVCGLINNLRENHGTLKDLLVFIRGYNLAHKLNPEI